MSVYGESPYSNTSDINKDTLMNTAQQTGMTSYGTVGNMPSAPLWGNVRSQNFGQASHGFGNKEQMYGMSYPVDNSNLMNQKLPKKNPFDFGEALSNMFSLDTNNGSEGLGGAQVGAGLNIAGNIASNLTLKGKDGMDYTGYGDVLDTVGSAGLQSGNPIAMATGAIAKGIAATTAGKAYVGNDQVQDVDYSGTSNDMPVQTFGSLSDYKDDIRKPTGWEHLTSGPGMFNIRFDGGSEAGDAYDRQMSEQERKWNRTADRFQTNAENYYDNQDMMAINYQNKLYGTNRKNIV